MADTAPQLPEPTVTLTPDQVAFYHREGYLVLDQISSEDELPVLRAAYDRIFTERAGREAGNQLDLGGTDEDGNEAVLPQILGFAQYAPEFLTSVMLANARAIAKALLGPEADASPAHAIYKPPHTGADTPWHQDEAYWNPGMNYQSLSIWVPLQEATPENGCMYFVPRSHKGEILRHQSINNDPRIHGLELPASEMDHVRGAVACPIPAGGCTIHDARTLHYAPANRSATPRRACIFGGALPATPRETPRKAPWLEEKRTARMQRAEQAQKAGPVKGGLADARAAFERNARD